jgi:hypothetical protein
MSIVGDDIACASSTSPASEYKLDSLCLFIVFLVSSYIFNMNINNHYDVIILLNNIMIYFMAFGIKIYHKIPKILKIKNIDCCDRLRVTSFVVVLKPNAFDGSNYKWWHNRMILCLTVMNIIHVAKGKRE